VKGLASEVVEGFLVTSEGCPFRARGREMLHHEVVEPQTAAEQSPFPVTLTLRQPEPGDDPSRLPHTQASILRADRFFVPELCGGASSASAYIFRPIACTPRRRSGLAPRIRVIKQQGFNAVRMQGN